MSMVRSNLGKVSIIIPVYNEEKHIEENYRTLCQQKYKNIEIIYVDDGSTDLTYRKLETIAQNDDRIHLISQENGGPAAARNSGLKMATGEYIAFLDADDEMDDDAISTMVETMVCYRVDFVMADVIRVNGHGIPLYRPWKEHSLHFEDRRRLAEVLRDYLYDERENRILCSVWGKLYRREVIEKYSIKFDETMRVHEDELFFFTYLLHASSGFYIREYLYKYYRNRNNTGSSAVRSNPLGFERHLKDIRDYLLSLVNEKRELDNILSLYGNAYCDYAISSCYHLVRLSHVLDPRLYIDVRRIIHGTEFRQNVRYYQNRNKDNHPAAVKALCSGRVLAAIFRLRIQIAQQNIRRKQVWKSLRRQRMVC